LRSVLIIKHDVHYLVQKIYFHGPSQDYISRFYWRHTHTVR
jgi:hypothetical protein